jgi:hypothetical protein
VRIRSWSGSIRQQPPRIENNSSRIKATSVGKLKFCYINDISYMINMAKSKFTDTKVQNV